MEPGLFVTGKEVAVTHFSQYWGIFDLSFKGGVWTLFSGFDCAQT